MSIWKSKSARLLAGVALAAVASPLNALAQTPQPQPPQAADAAGQDEIVVTGSLLGGNPADAQQPLQVVTPQVLEDRGDVNLADALRRLPALGGSNSVEQSIRDGAVAGRSSLNLRNLGANRTLTLVNGRRHVAGAPGTSAVDTSTIPSALIERVDVLTGGASAIYGSDAVTGVVNFILKDNFEGNQLDIQLDSSDQGDGLQLFGSWVSGFNFDGGKGNITFGLQFENRSGIRYEDRDLFDNNALPISGLNPARLFQTNDPLPPGVTAAQAVGRSILLSSGAPRFPNTSQALIDRARTASPQAILRDYRFGISAVGGLIGIDPFGFLFAAGPSDGIYAGANDINANGRDDCLESAIGRGLVGFTAGCWVIDRATGGVRPFRDGIIADGINQYGGDGAEQGSEIDSLTPDIRNVVFNVSGNYEVNDYFRPYFEFKAVQNASTEFSGYYTFDDTISVRLDNPYIPAQLRALANAEIAAQRALDPTYNAADFRFTIARDHIDIFDPRIEAKRESYRGVVGFKGEFDNGWEYDVSFNYGQTEETVESRRRLRDRFFAAADVTVDSQGRPACRITVTGERPIASFLDPNAFRTVAPVSYNPADCRPLNLFGLNNSSPEALAFQRYIGKDVAKIDQTVFTGILTGDTTGLVSLPGGPIEFAVGAEYREETSDFKPDPVDAQATNSFELRRVSATKGEYDVTEAFAEVRLPIFEGVPFADLLAINAAMRVGDYSTVGRTETWKVDGVYAPIPDFRLRGGMSQTVRAPNIFELFRGQGSFNANPQDVCLQSFINLGPNPANRLRNCSAAFGRDLALNPHNNRRTAQFAGTTQGNPNLREETSDAYTVGFVVRPSVLEGFTATVDYWNIRIEDAISTQNPDQIVANCYDAPNLNNSFCALFTRNLSGTPGTNTQFGWINSIRNIPVNFAAFEAAGVDFDFRYQFGLEGLGFAGLGDLTLAVSGTYLQQGDEFPFAAEPNRADPFKGELTSPEWNVNLEATWDWNEFSLSWFANYLSEQTERGVEIERASEWTPNTTSDTWVHDVSFRWEPDSNLRIVGGIRNLFEEEPYFTETSYPVSALGRTLFIRVGANF